jgi:hypothetical protein
MHLKIPAFDVEQGLIGLPGTPAGWIWAFTCPTRECRCRVAVVLSTPGDRETRCGGALERRKSLHSWLWGRSRENRLASVTYKAAGSRCGLGEEHARWGTSIGLRTGEVVMTLSTG